MLTTNTTKVRAKEDDGKRRVITTTNMKPSKVRFVHSRDFPGVQKREANKVDPKVKFNTTELDRLMNKFRRVLGHPEPKFTSAIKTPQPKRAKKAAPKKRKAK